MTPTPTNPAEPLPAAPVPPELLAWAKQTLDVDAFEAEMKEVQTSGGATFEEVVAAVEAAVRES